MGLSNHQNISAALCVSFSIHSTVWVIEQRGALSTYMPQKCSLWLGIEACIPPLSLRWNEFSRFMKHKS